MSRISLKKDLINSFSGLLSTDTFKNNHLVLITSIGIITGKPFFQNQISDASDICDAFNEIVKNIASDYFETNTCNESDLSENDGYLFLSDVTIQTSSSRPIKHQFMTVFYDQIIGVSIGHIN